MWITCLSRMASPPAERKCRLRVCAERSSVGPSPLARARQGHRASNPSAGTPSPGTRERVHGCWRQEILPNAHRSITKQPARTCPSPSLDELQGDHPARRIQLASCFRAVVHCTALTGSCGIPASAEINYPCRCCTSDKACRCNHSYVF
jgi:hypothetical protein